jgi:hypothetical protein
MRRTVLKCDACDTTVVDQDSFPEGLELWSRPFDSKSRSIWKKQLSWHFCKPCSAKVSKRLAKKYGEGATGDDD